MKAIQLQCIGELSRRIWKRKAIRSPVRFNDPAQVAEYYQEDLRHKEQEEFHMMLFNTKQNMIGDVALSKGTVNASLATPREIFIQALKFQIRGRIRVQILQGRMSIEQAAEFRENVRMPDRMLTSRIPTLSRTCWPRPWRRDGRSRAAPGLP